MHACIVLNREPNTHQQNTMHPGHKVNRTPFNPIGVEVRSTGNLRTYKGTQQKATCITRHVECAKVDEGCMQSDEYYDGYHEHINHMLEDHYTIEVPPHTTDMESEDHWATEGSPEQTVVIYGTTKVATIHHTGTTSTSNTNTTSMHKYNTIISTTTTWGSINSSQKHHISKMTVSNRHRSKMAPRESEDNKTQRSKTLRSSREHQMPTKWYQSSMLPQYERRKQNDCTWQCKQNHNKNNT